MNPCRPIILFLLTALAVAPRAARADGGVHSRFEPDSTAPESLWAWNDPVPWRVGLVAGRADRTVKMGGMECDWTGDSAEAVLSVAPWGWLEIYGRAGVNRGKMERGPHSAKTGAGAGGALGVALNLWEIGPDPDTAAWQVTIGLQGEYAYRTGGDKDGVKASWGEAFFFLPVDYHLSFRGTQRSTYSTEAHALDLYVGPACSLLDGDWTENGTKFSFKQKQAAGVAGGLRIWILPSLGIEGSLAWFDGATYRAGLQYRF